jgi:multidrug transporter EmrE-like cation transporter
MKPAPPVTITANCFTPIDSLQGLLPLNALPGREGQLKYGVLRLKNQRKKGAMRITSAEVAKLLLAISLLVSGQVLWKMGLTEINGFNLTQDFVASVTRAFTNFKVLGGLFLYALSTLLYFDVLVELPLSLVYPFMSLSYLVALIPAYFVLGEAISLLRVAAVGVIWLGILLLVRS